MLLYDRKTMSPWSQVLRTAITGERKGTTLDILPSTIESLGALLKKMPKAKVLSHETGYRRDYSRDPYGDYETIDHLYFPVYNSDDKAGRKDWSLYVEVGKEALIVPVTKLEAKKSEATVTVGGKTMVLAYDTKAGTMHVKKGPRAS